MPKNEIILTDDAIIELYWNRQENAISETDKKYGSYLYTIANNILKDGLDYSKTYYLCIDYSVGGERITKVVPFYTTAPRAS
jgi:hypothetical protein